MELNVEKIEKELARIGKKKAWLAKKCVVANSHLHYWFKTRTIKAAEPIAEVLGYDPKDLLK